MEEAAVVILSLAAVEAGVVVVEAGVVVVTAAAVAVVVAAAAHRTYSLLKQSVVLAIAAATSSPVKSKLRLMAN